MKEKVKAEAKVEVEVEVEKMKHDGRRRTKDRCEHGQAKMAACLDIAELRDFFGSDDLQPLRDFGHDLLVKLLALRKALNTPSSVPVLRS